MKKICMLSTDYDYNEVFRLRAEKQGLAILFCSDVNALRSNKPDLILINIDSLEALEEESLSQIAQLKDELSNPPRMIALLARTDFSQIAFLSDHGFDRHYVKTNPIQGLVQLVQDQLSQ